MPRRSFAARLALVAVPAVATLASCTGSSTPTGNNVASGSVAPGTTARPIVAEQPPEPFYRPPDPLPAGKPGEIIRSEAIEGAPAGSQAWRVLYHSTDINGRDIAVSGAVIAPTAKPVAARPVVSWAHPTTGVADRCAPSYTAGVFALVAGLQPLLDAGYVVAATDYEGLGTPGTHPFLVGASEGRGQVDVVRAARNLAEANAGSQVLFWGHSQGGQSSLFAAQLAPEYAPELKVAGVAAAAPAGKLSQLLGLIKGSEAGVTLGSFTLNAYLATYGSKHPDMNLDQVVSKEGQAALPKILALCNLQQSKELTDIAKPLFGSFFAGDAATTKPWSDLLQENVPGQVKIDAPVFIAQGSEDAVVVPSTTEQVVRDMCAKGTNVQLKVYDGTDHNLIGYTAAPDVVPWMAKALDGSAGSGTC